MLSIGKILRIVLSSVLLLIASIYILMLFPNIEVGIFASLSLNTWFSVILLFVIVQLLNLWLFKVLLYNVCRNTSLYKLSLIFYSSYALNFVGPLKIGVPGRVLLFKRILRVPYDAGVITVVLSTGLDVLMITTLAFASAAWLTVSPIAGLVLGLAAISMFTVCMEIYRRSPFLIPKRPAWLGSLLLNVADISLPVLLGAILISATKIVLNGFANWLVLVGLGPTVGLAEFCFAYFSSHMAGLLSFLPMGLGVRDASVIELLGRMGTSPSIGVAFVAIDRLVWTLIPLVLGLMAGWHLGVNELIKSVRSESEPDKVGIQ